MTTSSLSQVSPALTAAAGMALALGASAAQATIVSGTAHQAVAPGTALEIGGIGLSLSNGYDGAGAGFISQAGLDFASGGFVNKTAAAVGQDVAGMDFSEPFGGLPGLLLLTRDYNGTSGYAPLDGKLAGTGGGQAYFGFTFDQAAGTRYGWVEVAVVDNGQGNAFDVTLLGWGYENSGATIAVGETAPVPEPGTLALAAAGLAFTGAATRRRRQQLRQAA